MLLINEQSRTWSASQARPACRLAALGGSAETAKQFRMTDHPKGIQITYASYKWSACLSLEIAHCWLHFPDLDITMISTKYSRVILSCEIRLWIYWLCKRLAHTLVFCCWVCACIPGTYGRLYSQPIVDPRSTVVPVSKIRAGIQMK